MKVTGQVTFNASPEATWQALLDPGIISQAIPGCQELREVGVDTYTAVLRVGIGAVSGTYVGKLQISEKIPPWQYSMVFDGSGPQGFVQGAGTARLRAENGTTVVSYDCEMEIGGLLASVGQRMLEGASRFLIDQMFRKLRGYVERGNAGETRSV